MMDLLFNPQGRIPKRRFWQGLVVLTVALVILHASQVYLMPIMGLGAAALFMIPQVALLYVQICVYGKRFHDAGTTAWWIIAVWIASIVIAAILDTLFAGIFLGAEGAAIQEEVLERMQQGELQVAAEAAYLIAEKKLPLTIFTEIVAAVVLGFVVGSLPTQPGPNKHGPVPGGEHDAFN